ncbi:hypothetical protein QEZ48_07225 [Aquamicrobium lusatiense]|uniref:hypothetical protein n=1 Tax=Aquamicrobium lusatiense TaxID=89772 RepID=UPI002453D01E|nr:hypothetical protein [Aquamicrobium lusatiense]MDH4990623.1 hypothetical protein [Aquamicrobium lusatiense]
MRHETRQKPNEAAAGISLPRALLFALLATSALTVSPQPAAAFELFGIRLWGSAANDEDSDIVDPMNYVGHDRMCPTTMTILKKKLEDGLDC